MEAVGTIVPRALKTHVKRDKTPLLAIVNGLWPRVAGKAIAEQARPMAFSGGTLTLSASNEQWATQLQALSGEICAAVNKALGQQLVRYLRVRVGRPSCAQPDASIDAVVSGRASALADEVRFPWENGALATLDSETRTVLARSFAKYFDRSPRRTT